ncbi:protein GPR108 [Ixodes scapularis]
MLDVSDVVGRLGWYHAVLGAVTVLRAFPTAWTLLVVPFIVPPVEHWCAMPSLPSLQNWTQERWRLSALPVVRNGSDEQSVVLDGCHVHPLLDAESAVFDEENTVKCDSWTYNETVPGASAVPEWDLVCSNDWQRSLMQSVVFLGSLVGALIIGRLSDRFGRRFMFFTATFVYIGFGCAAAASPSASWYNSLRFFASVCIAGIQTTAAALFTEIVEPRHRMLLNVGFSLGFTLPTLLLPGVAYLLHNWKLLQLVAGLSGFILVPFIFVVQESPRWLVATRREKQAQKAIEKILRFNGRPVPDMRSTMSMLAEKSEKDVQLTSHGPAEILRHKRLLRNAICLFIIWFCDNFFMYATTLSSVDLGGSAFVNFALSAAAEIPAGLLSFPVVRYCRRKRAQAAMLLLAGIAAILTSVLPLDSLWMRLGLNMACRFILVISAAVKWVYSMEVFPTAVRGFGFSACFTVGRIGGMLAPFTRDLGIHTHFSVPTLVMGAAGVTGATAACFLPETLGADLPDTFEEADKLGSKMHAIELQESTK